MWAYELNDPNINPDNIGPGSEKEVYFKCLDNPKHIFPKRISKMTSHRDGHNLGCIFCGPNAKIPFPGETDLLSVIDKAKLMWDYEMNELDPTMLFPYSNKSAYFKCV